MSALRTLCRSCPDREVHPHAALVDLGWGSAHGHAMDGGRLARPEPSPMRHVSTPSLAAYDYTNEWKRRKRAELRAAREGAA